MKYYINFFFPDQEYSSNKQINSNLLNPAFGAPVNTQSAEDWFRANPVDTLAPNNPYSVSPTSTPGLGNTAGDYSGAVFDSWNQEQVSPGITGGDSDGNGGWQWTDQVGKDGVVSKGMISNGLGVANTLMNGFSAYQQYELGKQQMDLQNEQWAWAKDNALYNRELDDKLRMGAGAAIVGSQGEMS